jgi:hypothetical protein
MTSIYGHSRITQTPNIRYDYLVDYRVFSPYDRNEMMEVREREMRIKPTAYGPHFNFSDQTNPYTFEYIAISTFITSAPVIMHKDTNNTKARSPV